jgi:hypothetical protein
MNSERGKAVVDLAIDRSVAKQTAEIKEHLRSGDVYVRELVIGSGPHSQIYNAEKAVCNPGHPGLTIERSRRIGGQFASPEDGVWRLNTRTRAEDANANHLPGTEDSLNTLGRGAVQQSDLTGEAYGTQDTLADAIRINQSLVSRIMNRAEIIGIHDGDPDLPGDMKVEIRDTETGEKYILRTDRVVTTTGLGEPRTGLENADPETQNLVERELTSFSRTGRSRIMLLEQAVERLGDEHDPFPLRGMEEVGVIGPGDSGAIVAEYLLGYGPEPRKSVAQLDRVKKVIWVGQKGETREDFHVRQRYGMLGLEFPRKHVPEYAARIEPAAGRCFKLEEEGDKIRMHYRDPDGNETSRLVDHVILATGYVDTKKDLVKMESLDAVTEEAVVSEGGLPMGTKIAGAEIYSAGPGAHLDLSPQNIEESPAMRRMGVKKTVAVWAYAEETESLARMLAEKDRREGNPDDFLAETRRREKVALPELEETDSAYPIEIPLVPILSKDRLPAGVHGEDVLRFTIGEHLAGFSFPENAPGFQISVKRGGSESDPRFIIDITPGTIGNHLEYAEMLEDLMGDRVMQDMLQRLTERRVSRLEQVELNIPIRSGQAVLEDIEYHIPRQH